MSVFGINDYSKIVACALNVERVKKEEHDRKEMRQGKKNPGRLLTKFFDTATKD